MAGIMRAEVFDRHGHPLTKSTALCFLPLPKARSRRRRSRTSFRFTLRRSRLMILKGNVDIVVVVLPKVLQ